MENQSSVPKELDQIEQVLNAQDARAERRDLGNLCETYHRIKPLLETVLPWVGALPGGDRIVRVIRLLMTIAEQACPVA